MDPFRGWLARSSPPFPATTDLFTALDEHCRRVIRWALPIRGRFLDLWLFLHHTLRAINGMGLVTWNWWRETVYRELTTRYSPRSIRMGHRLFTHFDIIVESGASVSACNEKRDPLVALLKRVWPEKVHADKFHKSVAKLCTETNRNTASREASRAELRRVVLAYRLGWLGGQEPPRTVREYRELLLRFRNDKEEDEEEDIVDHELLLPALKAYVAWYIAQSVTLSRFMASVPQIRAGVPSNALATLSQCLLQGSPQLKRLVKATMDDSKEHFTDSYMRSVETWSQQVLDARDSLTAEQLDQVTAAALDGATLLLAADGLPLSVDCSDQLLGFIEKHYQHGATKAKFRAWFTALLQNESQVRDQVGLVVFFRTWAHRQLVYCIETPWRWVMNVAHEFECREARDGLTVSPTCDVFMYCPTCLRMCSICAPSIGSPFDMTSPHGRHHRRRKTRSLQASASGFADAVSAGFQDAVVDVDENRYLCASRKTGVMSQRCRESELMGVHLFDQMVVYCSRVYLLCPQPRCARLMELEPTLCRWNEHGPACYACTAGLKPRSVAYDPPDAPLPRRLTEKMYKENLAQAREEALTMQAFSTNEPLFD